jgi:HAD superfamily hydrolase (TIGR01662 family)
MDNIQWLFFDVGYTLVNEDDAHHKRIERLVKQQNALGNTISEQDIYEAISIASKAYTQPFATAMKILGIEKREEYPKECEKAYEDAIEVLRLLKKHYHIGIIANQTLGTEKRLTQYGIMPFIDVCIASAEEGIRKPDLGIFQLALERSACKAENAIMIGDRLDNDIYPAKKLGMKTVRIKQGFCRVQNPISDEYVPDYTINSLSELINIFVK